MIEINATQIAGLVSFGIAAMLCYRARRRAVHGLRVWGGLTALHVMIMADILLDGRHMLSHAIRVFLKSSEAYQGRRLWQVMLISLLLIGSAVIIWALLKAWARREDRSMLAACVTFCALCVFALEAVSLHRIDAILYAPAGPVLLIGWIWVILAACVTLLASRVHKPPVAPQI